MNKLKKLGIAMGDSNKAASIFENYFPDFLTIDYNKPSDYIGQLWNRYLKISEKERNSNQNGKIFEYLLATLLIREKILPLFLSAKVTFVPNVIYDLMLYTEDNIPWCISAKTSLRERYKQADLEAIALKYVHRRAKSYLVTLDIEAGKNVKTKIKSGDVIGLDDVVIANSPDFDELVYQMKSLSFKLPGKVDIITSNQIITKESISIL